MAILEDLMNQVPTDIDVLISLDAQGDNFNTQRDVDFVFLCEGAAPGRSCGRVHKRLQVWHCQA
ncbi:hypothetical protein [Pseudomonas kurunegalensis]|uniref:hypothetical protein n=1 Tax=Pseudomonas kurunegalensis TaxID=485880 RepID=UPI00257045C0|nr:hypothetical protein [Pseudomonas kurunegalensis]WJD60235.1 hypothetical protein QQ992_14925 [Pseudomonas kurunegalensis]